MPRIDSISNRHRALVYEAMREIRCKADRLLDISRALSPRNGAIPVGGEHFDAFVRGEWQVHRWEGAADSSLEDARRLVLNAEIG